MPIYESFNNKKRKLNHLWNKNNSEQDSVSHLEKITINLNDVSFTKNIFKKTLAENTLLSSTVNGGTLRLTIDFPVIPTWAIPMTHIVTVGNLTDANNPDDVSITLTTRKHWIQLGDNHFELHLVITGSANGAIDYPPLYINVNMYIINENDYSVTQTEGE